MQHGAYKQEGKHDVQLEEFKIKVGLMATLQFVGSIFNISVKLSN